ASSAGYDQALQYLRPGGVLVAVGLPPGAKIEADVFWTVVRSITVKGSYVGNREDARQALDIAARGRVRTTYRVEPLGKLPEVFKEMKEGKLAGRVVLDLSLRWNLSQPPARTPQFRFSARPDETLPTDLTISALEQYLPGLPAAPAPRAAVQIIWLLYLIIEAASPTERVRYSSSRQEWMQSTRVKRARENLENLLLTVWRDFLNGARDDSVEERDEIEDLLWYRVGLSNDANVVDMLTHEAVPLQFLCDPALQISLNRTWRHGLVYDAQ
ncbi:alcohol dehydrogenase, partial [Ceratobasidium sp. 392]